MPEVKRTKRVDEEAASQFYLPLSGTNGCTHYTHIIHTWDFFPIRKLSVLRQPSKRSFNLLSHLYSFSIHSTERPPSTTWRYNKLPFFFSEFITTDSIQILFFSIFADPPVIVEAPSPVRARAGGIAAFTCVASGDPTPHITWKRNGNRIQQSQARWNQRQTKNCHSCSHKVLLFRQVANKRFPRWLRFEDRTREEEERRLGV